MFFVSLYKEKALILYCKYKSFILHLYEKLNYRPVTITFLWILLQNSLNSQQSIDSRMSFTQIYTKTTTYKSQIVAMKVYENKNLVISRRMQKEMKLVTIVPYLDIFQILQLQDKTKMTRNIVVTITCCLYSITVNRVFYTFFVLSRRADFTMS